MSLQRRLLLAFAGISLGVVALFSAFAWGLSYRIETDFLAQALDDEAAAQRAHFVQQGRWRALDGGILRLYPTSELPTDLAALVQDGAAQQGVGEAGRTYRWRRLGADGPWLAVELSQQIAVRPMRQLLGGWIAAALLTLTLFAWAAAWGLSRWLSRPLQELAARVQQQEPGSGPLATGLGQDEVGQLARAFDAQQARSEAFLQREQTFLRDASHELRTPVSVLRMAIERLQADTRLPPLLAPQLSPMHAATRGMQQTLEALLLLAREDLAEPASTAVLPLVEDWVLAHAALLDTRRMRLELQISSADTLPLPGPVLHAVLASLLGNALQHGAVGSRVDVWMRDGALHLENPVAEAAIAGGGLGLDLVQRLLARCGTSLAFAVEAGRARASFGATCGAKSGARSGVTLSTPFSAAAMPPTAAAPRAR